MAFHLRPYAGEQDKRQMIQVAHTAPDENLHVMDLPYRLSSWAFDVPENVGLWTDDAGQLAAWAVLQTPFWAIDFALTPRAESAHLLPTILAWADERAHATLNTPSGHPMWFANVRTDQPARIAALEAAGFACQDNVMPNPWSKTVLSRFAQTPVADVPLPDGITIRPLAGEAEADTYAALHRSVFQSPSMRSEWRSQTLQWPEYRPECDLVAANSDGQLIAFCIGWFDPAGWKGQPCGQIEPMGVREDWQRRGVGQAVLSECLRRLYRAGAVCVCVESDRPNPSFDYYQTVGFAPEFDIHVYRKDYLEA